MKRLLNRLYYLVETLLLKGSTYQLLIVATAILLVTGAGGTALHLFSPEYKETLLQAWWWAFLRLTDPGYLGDDTGTVPRVLSTVLTLAGYVVFLGALVAIMTNRLNRLMSDLASGFSPIFEEDHILIIRWNGRIHSLVEEIVHAEERVKRRLGRARLPAVVVLTREFEPDLLPELRDKLDPEVRDEVRILIRAGNPLEAESLERVDFKRASSIILVSPFEQGTNRHLSDVQLTKTLLSLKAETRDLPPEQLPNVVLEIGNPANKLLAERAGWTRKTEAIATDEFISRLLAHTVRNPGLSSIYNHLLTDTFGESIFLRKVHRLNLQRRRLREAVEVFDHAIPIGVLRPSSAPRRQEKRLQLLHLEARLEPDDELIFVAPSLDALHTPTEITPGLAQDSEVTVEPEQEAEVPEGERERPERRLMFVGWSHLLAPIFRELADYRQEHFHITLVTDLPREECRKRLRLDLDRMENLTVLCRRVAVDDPDAVEELAPDDIDNIVLLSSELADDTLMADAETIMAFYQLREYFRRLDGRFGETGEGDGTQQGDALEATGPAFVMELNDEDNRDLFQLGALHDVIMTQEIVSHLLSQVAVRRALAWIYEELFTQDGPEIRLRSVRELFEGEPTETVHFHQIQEYCLDAGLIALGVRYREAQPGGRRVRLNPGAGAELDLRGEDQIVVIVD